MQDEYIDVNSELYFNEKLNVWLNELKEQDIKLVLEKCFSIPATNIAFRPNTYPMDSGDHAYSRAIRFDQKVDFGNELCVIFELKIGTEATPGQLRNYLEYIQERGYRKGYVILLSRNKLAREKSGYDTVIETYPNLIFTTWGEFESKLSALFNGGKLGSPKKTTETFLALLSYITDIRKRSERLNIKSAPPALNAGEYIKKLEPAAQPRSKGPFLGWTNREHFWNELTDQIHEHTGKRSICTFRFDLYEYLIRWAFHKKQVYLDIYEDKNYEYYYNYFIEHIFPQKANLPAAQLSELYYRFLLIRKDEVLHVDDRSIFLTRVGRDWYGYVIHDKDHNIEIPYLRLSDYNF
jgi:hypothetical protein